jgi:glutamate-1-semialdehyde 2,1-aminomutase
MSINRYKNSELLLKRALETIPLGSQTFSKSITQYPRGVSPLFVTHGKGSHIWDVDGNEYIDFVNGLASVTIGYSNEIVNNAVKQQIDNGVTFSLPHKLELEVAELLVELVPCAEKVRFGKNGTDVTSASIRLARAYTGREHVAVCGYHGWQDWYIGSTTRSLGVPECVKELTHVFQYNNISSLERLFRDKKNKIAAVIMEPMNVSWPEENYLSQVKKIVHDNGALLIFDENITGCRFSKGGAQELFGVVPDISVFGKGLGNGFPISAIVGKSKIMNVMEDIFFSGTFGGETASLAAAKAVLEMIRDDDVIEHMHNIGEKILTGVEKLLLKHKANELFEITGHPSWTILTIKDTIDFTSWEIRTLFLQEMFRRGILISGSHNISYSHNEEDVDKLLSVYNEVFPLIVNATSKKTLFDLLEAEVLVPLFKIR